MRETGPASAIVTPCGLPADRRDAALALEARSPATRRAYRAALARLEETLVYMVLRLGRVHGPADGRAPIPS